MKLVKIGAKVVKHGSYGTFQLAEVAVSRDLFREILRLIDTLRPKPALVLAPSLFKCNRFGGFCLRSFGVTRPVSWHFPLKADAASLASRTFMGYSTKETTSFVLKYRDQGFLVIY